MDHNETGCQAPPEAPMLCVNNCGFFGSAATMNMCSKCHKDMVLKQEQAKLAASSIESIIEGSSSSNAKVSAASITPANVQTGPVESLPVSTPVAAASPSETDNRVKGAPNRCSSCSKRVGLTGFKCRCGNLFCAMHRYSDKHDCPFDYQTAARDAIAKSNPVIKPDKLDKI